MILVPLTMVSINIIIRMKIPNDSSILMDELAIFEVKQYGFWLNLKLSHNLDINNDI